MSTPSGPPLATLTRRLLETPGDFLLEPRTVQGDKVRGVVHVDALASDTLVWLGGAPLTITEAEPLRSVERGAQGPVLKLVLLACWILHDPWFRGREALVPGARTLLLSGLRALAGAVRPADCVTDDDRREELARLTLQAVNLLPGGESPEAARDRLASLDSVARARVAKAAAEAAKRAQQIREAAAKAAAEAASYYGRE